MRRRRLKKGLIEKFINILLDIFIFLFGVILLISIYNNIQIKILKNPYSSFFGYSVFEVQTGSMADTINIGDWIVVKYAKNIKLDDIITYEHEGEFITHRVIESYKGTYVTKGDANNAKDDPISQEQIVGKVVKILSNFGILRMTLFNPIVLIALIITLYLISTVFKNKNGTKKNEKLVWEVNGNMGKIFEKIRKWITARFLVDEWEVLDRDDEPANSVSPSNTYEDRLMKMMQGGEEIKEIPTTPTFEKTEAEKKEPQKNLDQTIYFRMISVDKDELDNAFNPAEEIEVEEETISEEPIEELDETNDDAEIKVELELIQKKKKKCKNILQKTMLIKTEELQKILDILNRHEKSKTNEASIKELLLKTYIDAKYYNFCGDVNVAYNGRNMATRIASAIQNTANKMIKQYKGNDKKYEDKVTKYANFFLLIIYLEQTFIMDVPVDQKRETYKNKILKYLRGAVYEGPVLKEMIAEILRVQKLHASMIKYIFEKMDTNMFELEYSTLTAKKTYAVSLKHNITFSKVYSDYIVDKTYRDGIVAEDKIPVLLSLLLEELTKDILRADFLKRYMFYIPYSLYDKENKLSSIFDRFKDEYAKTNIIVVINYETLSSHKKIVRSLIKEGYHFAVDIGEASAIKSKDQGCVELMEYIFISKKNKEKKNILASIKKEAGAKVLYDDIKSKVASI